MEGMGAHGFGGQEAPGSSVCSAAQRVDVSHALREGLEAAACVRGAAGVVHMFSLHFPCTSGRADGLFSALLDTLSPPGLRVTAHQRGLSPVQISAPKQYWIFPATHIAQETSGREMRHNSGRYTPWN